MERESNPMQALCRSGCGFYGSPATDGLCSLCYKEALKKKQQPPGSSNSAGGGGGSPAGPGPAPGLAASLIDTAQPTCPVIAPPAPAPTPAVAIDTGKDQPISLVLICGLNLCSVISKLTSDMDSDSDQDEEDIHRSLSVTINEVRSIGNIGRRVGSECSIIAVECVSASESTTLYSVENVDNFSVTEITSEDDLTDSITFTEDEDPKEPPIKIIKVSCQRQVRKELNSNIADDRIFTAEKAMDEHDPEKPPENQKDFQSEESGASPDSTTAENATNPLDPTNPSNSPEQTPTENDQEVTPPDTMETSSSPIPISLVTPDSMEATHGSNQTSSVSPGTAETPPSTTSAPVIPSDTKGISPGTIPASLTVPNKRESQEEKIVDRIEGKVESSSDHAVQSCTSKNNLPHGSTHFASKLSQCTSLLDVEMILVENLLNTCLAAIEKVLPEEYQESSVLASENPPTEETVGTVGAESTNLPGTTDSPVPVTGHENVQSSGAVQLAGKKRKHSAKKTADAEGAVGGSSAENSVSSGDAEESFENKDSDKEAKKKKNRCAVCRKKVGLTGFECRCGGLFCAVHRYSDKHDCTFDYREMGAQEIRRNNPVVVGEKIQKI